jgi:hypothetical protein
MAYLLQSSKPTQELEAFEKAVHRTIGVSIVRWITVGFWKLN